jgi:hypothetical protein
MATRPDTATAPAPYPLSLGVLRHALDEVAEKVSGLEPTAQVRQLELRTEALRRELRLLPVDAEERLPGLIDAAVALESEVATVWRDAGHPRAGNASTLVPG